MKGRAGKSRLWLHRTMSRRKTREKHPQHFPISFLSLCCSALSVGQTTLCICLHTCSLSVGNRAGYRPDFPLIQPENASIDTDAGIILCCKGPPLHASGWCCHWPHCMVKSQSMHLPQELHRTGKSGMETMRSLPSPGRSSVLLRH